MTETDADTILDRAGFDPEESILTRRQAEVLALRERGLTQSAIADRFGTSRANVASIESSARENVRKARDTVAVAEALRSPVQVEIEAGTDLYDVPADVFDACDDADVKVPYTAPELLGTIAEEAGDAVVGRQVRTDLLVCVGADGTVRVRHQQTDT
ncbi:Tfx family DNA-binding protein [Halapricum hydrolyticum]|uniref:Tfx family DNA-binding protein n=1 Tax=Halapricum hydrolyticum TaxID=2979991 RepID=A0AAE3IA31_9EURY|nr:Tfx family DNA-binding protein [Halapricum hydrolyticum]MCU4716536.1 Tfx family DNA-binding protein [Halapricum hydrolyticum]MCU4725859.1 Tfx family DNA-binding protein [Halapricum hydrolyticum]